MELEFWVTICLGHGDGGDVAVTLDVTDAEYELLRNQKKATNAASAPGTNNNRFHNFHQRDTDIDSLESALISNNS